jgi:hypothetical protein
VDDYPEGLEAFFFVNTDVGTPECAALLAERLAAAGANVLTLRCLIPRTFVDCNRLVDSAAGEVTPGLPPYVAHDGDAALLGRLHADYQEQARRAYAEVCGTGGLALTLHTYAPRSVDIKAIDDEIVDNLRRCYEPARYEQFELRPAVELISEDVEGELLGPPDLFDRLQQAYATVGVKLEQNRTYRLHRGTMGLEHSTRYPGRVICLEIRRDLLADPFTPFAEMRIAPQKVERMTAPLAAVVARLASRPVKG